MRQPTSPAPLTPSNPPCLSPRAMPATCISASRSTGLDAVRTLAIGAVLLCHLPGLQADFFPLTPWQTTTSVLLGYYGVELFFVLSGFLIGDILFREVVPAPSLRTITLFFARRWLRILPAYYIVLLLLTLLERSAVVPPWDYLLLVQNYDRAAEHFFPVSWSLTIEHWSYIIAPLVLLVLPRFFARISSSAWQRIALALLTLFLLCTLARLGATLLAEVAWDAGIRKQIHLRLDAVFFGVLVVGCRHHWTTLYARFTSTPFLLLVLALLLLFIRLQAGVMLADHTPAGPDHSLFFQTIGFSLSDLLLALLLPWFADHQRLNTFASQHPFFQRCCTWGSRYAYSIYLVHYSVFLALRQTLAFLPPTLSPWTQTAVVGCAMATALTCSCLLAFLLYHGIEKPGMDLRRFLRQRHLSPSTPLPTAE